MFLKARDYDVWQKRYNKVQQKNWGWGIPGDLGVDSGEGGVWCFNEFVTPSLGERILNSVFFLEIGH